MIGKDAMVVLKGEYNKGGRNAAVTRPLRKSYSAASTLPALRRRTRLAQYGGPRAGVRFGTSVGSPMPGRYRATLIGSVTSASSFILPLQHGHVRTSNPNVRLRTVRRNFLRSLLLRALEFFGGDPRHGELNPRLFDVVLLLSLAQVRTSPRFEPGRFHRYGVQVG